MKQPTKEEQKKPRQTIQEPIEKEEQPDTGYQLVPKSRSYIPQTSEETPQIAQAIGTIADAAVSVADEVVEGLGDLITPTSQGDNYAEVAWQRKLRNQASRKKKRGRGL